MKYTHVLLVDDDSDDQEFFEEALKLISDQLTYTAADNGKKALELLEKQDRLPDIIFLDWNMPVMNGQQFLEEIRKREAFCHIPVVIISTSSHTYTMDTAFALGATRFITKPTNFKALVDALSLVILE